METVVLFDGVGDDGSRVRVLSDLTKEGSFVEVDGEKVEASKVGLAAAEGHEACLAVHMKDGAVLEACGPAGDRRLMAEARHRLTV